MRWFALKEGYQKKPLWVNIDQVTHLRFTTGSDGLPMAFMVVSNGSEITTHDQEDLDKLQKVLTRNSI